MMGSGQADLIEQSDWPRLAGFDGQAWPTVFSSPTGLDLSD